ncbi:hypothetical protein D7Z26_00450 [Cohnella endophytica]|uniref:Uncharacterized protein n=1 Tax=Cohnella endophytica TaxID=2419778 RepID=A0A494Y5P6_9BACL|nr:hypothetical protein [Cohnella endophytica]RKP58017.1 hypothetical protein D7Z26_00450 [Cohnella endophytica]
MNQRNKKIRLAKFYGYVSDPLITTVVLRLRGTELRQTIADDRMFLFLWNDAEKNYVWLSIQGLDNAGNVLYEQELQ